MLGKIGSLASKNPTSRYIPSKGFNFDIYHQKMPRYRSLAFCLPIVSLVPPPLPDRNAPSCYSLRVPHLRIGGTLTVEGHTGGQDSTSPAAP
jgi:hypothetical protein